MILGGGEAVVSSEATSPEQVEVTQSLDDDERLGVLLGVLRDEAPDLALIVEPWDRLPLSVRVGIVAMVRSTYG